MSKRVRQFLFVLLLLLLVLLALLWARCSRVPGPVSATSPSGEAAAPANAAPTAFSPAAEEVLTPATLDAPAEVAAGVVFRVRWTGPNNPGDYLTIVPANAPPERYENYAETRQGNPLELTAPIEPANLELRYVAARSKTVLGRAPLVVAPVAATLDAAGEVVLGKTLDVAWTGPNNAGDYITLVSATTPDGQYGNYTETAKGSPLVVTAPVEVGAAELRYMSGQGRKVLARRPVKVVTPEVALSAPAEVPAGSIFSVTWMGPANPQDYITVVAKGTPDGQYRNYTDTAKGSPLNLTAPIDAGEAELRYMTGRGARVLARRPINIVAVDVVLDAPERVIAGKPVPITWTGPKNAGDYLTIVPAATPDGKYGNYSDASRGSPLNVTAPIRPGPCELRYMSGQGAKVLGRRALLVEPASITLKGPARAAAGSVVEIEWTGPNNQGDYLTVIAKTAKDGDYFQSVQTERGSPAKVPAPLSEGPCEVRYMSGQGNLVLARIDIDVTAAQE